MSRAVSAQGRYGRYTGVAFADERVGLRELVLGEHPAILHLTLARLQPTISLRKLSDFPGFRGLHLWTPATGRG